MDHTRRKDLKPQHAAEDIGGPPSNSNGGKENGQSFNRDKTISAEQTNPSFGPQPPTLVSQSSINPKSIRNRREERTFGRILTTQTTPPALFIKSEDSRSSEVVSYTTEERLGEFLDMLENGYRRVSYKLIKCEDGSHIAEDIQWVP